MIQKLSVGEKTGYALGDMAANFVFQAMLALQLDFYTHTFGLTAAQAGTLFLFVGLGVAFFNPVMGVIADRTTSKWGKFRPWLLWTAVPFGITCADVGAADSAESWNSDLTSNQSVRRTVPVVTSVIRKKSESDRTCTMTGLCWRAARDCASRKSAAIT